MAKPRISMGIPDHPRTRAIIDGDIKIDGYELDLTYKFASPGERHYRFAQGEYDIGEYSAARRAAPSRGWRITMMSA